MSEVISLESYLGFGSMMLDLDCLLEEALDEVLDEVLDGLVNF